MKMVVGQELHSTWKGFAEKEKGGFHYDESVFVGGDKFRCTLEFSYPDFDLLFIFYRHRTATASAFHKKEFLKVLVPLDKSTELQLDIVPESMRHRLLKKIGWTELEVGEAELDQKYFIQTNSESEIKAVLTKETVLQPLIALHPIRLRVKNGKEISEMELPADQKFLFFATDELIGEEATLKNLLDLFQSLATELKKSKV